MSGSPVIAPKSACPDSDQISDIQRPTTKGGFPPNSSQSLAAIAGKTDCPLSATVSGLANGGNGGAKLT